MDVGGFGMTKDLNSLLFHKDALRKQRTLLLERLAECADRIKRIDEQLKLV
jgi:hypothetical protein